MFPLTLYGQFYGIKFKPNVYLSIVQEDPNVIGRNRSNLSIIRLKNSGERGTTLLGVKLIDDHNNIGRYKKFRELKHNASCCVIYMQLDNTN